jgi:LL-H family phage holin
MSNIVFDIIRIVVFAVFLVATKYILPLVTSWLQEKISENQYSLLLAVVESVVQGLEQEFKGESGKGTTKKEQATTFVKEYCEKHNIDMSDEQISALIESAVYGINEAKA